MRAGSARHTKINPPSVPMAAPVARPRCLARSAMRRGRPSRRGYRMGLGRQQLGSAWIRPSALETHIMTTVGISDLHPYHDTTGTLVVTYEGKEALVELQGLAPLYPREPRQEICRRAMLELI